MIKTIYYQSNKEYFKKLDLNSNNCNLVYKKIDGENYSYLTYKFLYNEKGVINIIENSKNQKKENKFDREKYSNKKEFEEIVLKEIVRILEDLKNIPRDISEKKGK